MESAITLQNWINGGSVSEVWFDVWFNNELGSSPIITFDSVSTISFDSDNRLTVYDSSALGSLLLPDVASASGWRHLIVKSDYAYQVSDYYMDGARVLQNVAFEENSPFLNLLEIQGPILIDDLNITSAKPAGLDDDRNGLNNEEELIGY